MLLVGDIGGTHTRLALVHPTTHRVLRRETFASREFDSFFEVAGRFLGANSPPLTSVCLGAAGPVIAGQCVITNLPWRLAETELQKKLKSPRARLVNDLVAVGWGAAHAPRRQLVALNGPRWPSRSSGTLAILSPGTGLGEAALVADGDRHVLLATEGSHGDFAPRNQLEFELLEFLQRRFGRVSTERALCGPALPELYTFFRDRQQLGETSANRAALHDADDFNFAMVELGVSGKSRPARAAVDLFASLLAAEAGNLALRYLSLGGVYLAGTLASALLPRLRRAAFRQSFTAKGRYRQMLQRVPVAVVNDAELGLRGAALLAG